MATKRISQATTLLRVNPFAMAIANASSFASLNKRDKRKRNYNHEAHHDVASKTPTSPLGCSVKQPLAIDDAPSFASLHKREKRMRNYHHETHHDAATKTPTSPLGCRFKQPLAIVGAPTSFASLDKCDETKRNQHHEVCDEATKTETSLGQGIELEVQPESPPSRRSCTSCQTQGDATCFKCFVAAADLFAGLQQFCNKSGCKYDYNKTFEKETYASFY